MLSTSVMVANDGATFYIGALEKSNIVRSVNKVPVPGSIPVLGWLFSAESEILKKKRIVAVLEVVPVNPDTKETADFSSDAERVEQEIESFGMPNRFFDENSYGFGQ